MFRAESSFRNFFCWKYPMWNNYSIDFQKKKNAGQYINPKIKLNFIYFSKQLKTIKTTHSLIKILQFFGFSFYKHLNPYYWPQKRIINNFYSKMSFINRARI